MKCNPCILLDCPSLLGRVKRFEPTPAAIQKHFKVITKSSLIQVTTKKCVQNSFFSSSFGTPIEKIYVCQFQVVAAATVSASNRGIKCYPVCLCCVRFPLRNSPKAVLKDKKHLCQTWCTI